MSRKAIHLEWAHQLAPVHCRVAYCRKSVSTDVCVERKAENEGKVTCKRCRQERDAETHWHEHFKAELEAREARGEPEARRRAWLATEAAIGKNPRGFPVPKRSVEIHWSRGEDGRGRWEVAAPKGARFASGPHARTFGSLAEAERVKGEVELERCPDDCGCGFAKPIGAKTKGATA